jgi:hypothetical protein
MGKVLIVEALGGNVNGVTPYAVKFNSGNQIVPPGEWAFSQFEPERGLGLYWGRIFTPGACSS